MKRKIIALLLLVCVAVLVLAGGAYGEGAATREIHSFDPTQHSYQYDPVEFTLPVVDNHWVPVSETRYDGEDQVVSVLTYTAENNELICTDRENIIVSWPQFGEAVNYLSREAGVEEYDELGRTVYQMDVESETYYETVHFAYGKVRGEASESLCGIVRRMCDSALKYAELSPPVGDAETVTSYEIVSFGQFGYASRVWADLDSVYIETNRRGELQKMSVSKPFGYWVYRFDTYGRVMWSASYDWDGALIEYTVYKYKRIDE